MALPLEPDPTTAPPGAPPTGGGMMNAVPGGQSVPTAADAPPEQAPDGAGETVTDPELVQLVKGIEAKIDPAMRKDYDKIMIAGMKILFSEQTHHLLVIAAQKIKAGSPDEVPKTVATISAGLIGLIDKELGGKIPVPPSFLAVITLMSHVLEYLQATGVDANNEVIATTTKETYQTLLKYFKITPEMLDRALKLKQQGGDALQKAADEEAAQATQAPAPAPDAAPAGPTPTGMMNSAPGM